MAEEVEKIVIRDEISLKQLLQKLKSGESRVDFMIPLHKYSGTVVTNEAKFIENINKEVVKRGIRKFMFNICSKSVINILRCFIGTKPEKCIFSINDGSNIFDDVSCRQFFRIFRNFKSKVFVFNLKINCVTDSFVQTFAAEIQDLSAELSLLEISTNRESEILHSGIDSFQVLNNLSKFNNLKFVFKSFELPRQFGYKLIYQIPQRFQLKISAANIEHAYNLVLKNKSKNLIISITEIYSVTHLLPLFVSSSKNTSISLEKPKSHLSRGELKVVINKRRQFFNYGDSTREAVGSLPLSSKEVEYLEKQEKFIAYKYTFSL